MTMSTYPFTNGAAQLGPLQSYLDPITERILDDLGLQPGWRCLEIGPGAGSITRHLLDHTAELGGHVTVIDRDTSMLTPAPHLTIHQHDLEIPGPLPGTGPYDLITGRLVTQWVRRRVSLVPDLAALLAPGGRLVLGEFVDAPLRVLRAPARHPDGPDPEELFHHILGALLQVLTAAGADMDWGHRLHQAMTDAGLEAVHTSYHAESWTGGSYGCHLWINNIIQQRRALIDHGITGADLDVFLALMQNPQFTARSYEIAYTVGRRADEDS